MPSRFAAPFPIPHLAALILGELRRCVSVQELPGPAGNARTGKRPVSPVLVQVVQVVQASFNSMRFSLAAGRRFILASVAVLALRWSGKFAPNCLGRPDQLDQANKIRRSLRSDCPRDSYSAGPAWTTLKTVFSRYWLQTWRNALHVAKRQAFLDFSP